MSDPVDHPTHYTAHPSGIECIDVVEHMGFSLGNAIKYISRADLKGDAIEDLKKARWYLDREIARREAARTAASDDTGPVVIEDARPGLQRPAMSRPDTGSTVRRP